MRKENLYVETSVWSHCFADDTPERRESKINGVNAVMGYPKQIRIATPPEVAQP